ncbi:MAG: prephenate dehydratase domain-containing protein [Pyrinomonadaceae bacterium]
METVAIQGIRGSYSEQATHFLFGDDVEIHECVTFDETLNRVIGGAARYAVLPVANTIVGEITATVSLLKQSSLPVINQIRIRVQHVLAGTPDAEFANVSFVRSHVEALKQCKKFLNANPQIEQIGGADTASSIRRIVIEGDPTHAAIGSGRAAELYGAKILKENIADDIDNWTTFFLIGN